MAQAASSAPYVDPNDPTVQAAAQQNQNPGFFRGLALRLAQAADAGDGGSRYASMLREPYEPAMLRGQLARGQQDYANDQAFQYSLLHPNGAPPAQAPTSIAATLAANPPQQAQADAQAPTSLAAKVAPASQPLSSAPPPQPQPASLAGIAANAPAPLPQGGDDALMDLGIGPEGTNQTSAAAQPAQPGTAPPPVNGGAAPASPPPVMTGPQFAALVQQHQAQKRAATLAALGVGGQSQAPAQAPQPVTSPAPGVAPPVQSGSPSPLATQRAFLAARALRNGDPAGAGKILSEMGAVPEMDVANGVAYDKHNTAPGSRIGVNLTTSPSGIMVDPNNPSNTNRDIGTAPPVAGAKPTYDAQGNLAGWALPDGTLQAIGATEAAKSGAQEAAKAPYTPVTTYNADGSPNVVSAAQFAGQGNGAPPAPGQPSGAPAAGGSVANKSFAEADAKQLSDNIGKASDLKDSATQQETAALQAQQFTRSHKMSEALPHQVALANVARAVGFNQIGGVNLNQFSNDAANYQRNVTTSMLANARASFPNRVTNTDIKVASATVPSLKDPNESSDYYWATQAAMAQRKQERAQFVASYGADPNTPKTNGAMENAWNNGPGAQSLFQSPAFQGVTVNGKPAVKAYTYNGKPYGLVALGNGQSQVVPFK